MTIATTAATNPIIWSSSERASRSMSIHLALARSFILMLDPRARGVPKKVMGTGHERHAAPLTRRRRRATQRRLRPDDDLGPRHPGRFGELREPRCLQRAGAGTTGSRQTLSRELGADGDVDPGGKRREDASRVL